MWLKTKDTLLDLPAFFWNVHPLFAALLWLLRSLVTTAHWHEIATCDADQPKLG